MTQQEYISNLHEDFRRVVGSYLTAIEFFLTQPQITDADMRALEQYKTLSTAWLRQMSSKMCWIE